MHAPQQIASVQAPPVCNRKRSLLLAGKNVERLMIRYGCCMITAIRMKTGVTKPNSMTNRTAFGCVQCAIVRLQQNPFALWHKSIFFVSPNGTTRRRPSSPTFVKKLFTSSMTKPLAKRLQSTLSTCSPKVTSLSS